MGKEFLVESLIEFLPSLHKKFFKGIPFCELTKQQFELLHYLKVDGEKPMNHYCTKLMVSKPNLTVIADKLIEEGFVERDSMPNDRRVVILKLTEKGSSYVHKQMEKIKTIMIEMLDGLDEDDIDRLVELLKESQAILSKLDEMDTRV